MVEGPKGPGGARSRPMRSLKERRGSKASRGDRRDGFQTSVPLKTHIRTEKRTEGSVW